MVDERGRAVALPVAMSGCLGHAVPANESINGADASNGAFKGGKSRTCTS